MVCNKEAEANGASSHPAPLAQLIKPAAPLTPSAPTVPTHSNATPPVTGDLGSHLSLAPLSVLTTFHMHLKMSGIHPFLKVSLRLRQYTIGYDSCRFSTGLMELVFPKRETFFSSFRERSGNNEELVTILLIQLCLIHTTACYDKVFRGSLDPASLDSTR